jgi:hypothetical protein
MCPYCCYADNARRTGTADASAKLLSISKHHQCTWTFAAAGGYDSWVAYVRHLDQRQTGTEAISRPSKLYGPGRRQSAQWRLQISYREGWIWNLLQSAQELV